MLAITSNATPFIKKKRLSRCTTELQIDHQWMSPVTRHILYSELSTLLVILTGHFTLSHVYDDVLILKWCNCALLHIYCSFYVDQLQCFPTWLISKLYWSIRHWLQFVDLIGRSFHDRQSWQWQWQWLSSLVSMEVHDVGWFAQKIQSTLITKS